MPNSKNKESSCTKRNQSNRVLFVRVVKRKFMLTDFKIQALIEAKKRIVHKNPVKGFREENRHLGCRLELESVSDEEKKFKVFIRKSVEFIENFSIGFAIWNQLSITENHYVNSLQWSARGYQQAFGRPLRQAAHSSTHRNGDRFWKHGASRKA